MIERRRRVQASIRPDQHRERVLNAIESIAHDEAGRRTTDKLSNVPAIGRMIQTMALSPSGAGTKLCFHYSIAPEAPIETVNLNR